MTKKSYRFIFALTLLAAASLACTLFSGLSRDVGQLRSTAQSVATTVKQGQELIQTGQAVATQVLGNEIVQTARAFATEQGSELLATGQAFITQEGPGLLATGQTIATEQGPSLLATMQAAATQQGPGLLETMQAAATQIGPGLEGTMQAVATQAASPGGAPADIPQVEGGKTNLIATNSFVSYTTPLDLRSVMDFYEREMPNNGWTKVEQGSVVSAASAIFIYEKPGRRATLTISADTGVGATLVVIAIQ